MHRAFLIVAIFILAVVVIFIPAVGAVLVAALVALLEIVLVLASRNIALGLVAVCSAAIDARVCPTETHVAAAVAASGPETLSVAFVYSLSKYFNTAIVGLVIRTVSVNAIACILVDVIILPIEIDAT